MLSLVSAACMVCRPIRSHGTVLVLPLLVCSAQAVHPLVDPGDSELSALAGGDILKTVKITKKELRVSSKIARAGIDRLAAALTTVCPHDLVCLSQLNVHTVSACFTNSLHHQ